MCFQRQTEREKRTNTEGVLKRSRSITDLNMVSYHSTAGRLHPQGQEDSSFLHVIKPSPPLGLLRFNAAETQLTHQLTNSFFEHIYDHRIEAITENVSSPEKKAEHLVTTLKTTIFKKSTKKVQRIKLLRYFKKFCHWKKNPFEILRPVYISFWRH